jgi:hypothetical protein
MESNLYSNNSVLQSINNTNPIYLIKEAEFDDALLKFGSLISMLKNKRINQTMLLVELLDSEEYRECFKALSGIEKTDVLFYNLIVRFPVLCKSKIVKTKIKEINDGRRRKKIK